MTTELDNIVEALIFASPEGASTKEITRCIRSAVATSRETDGENAPEEMTRFAATIEEDVVTAISRLNMRYLETERAFMLVERPAGWRIVSRMEYALWVRELFPDKKPARLSPSALETLAIIAYRQPITRSSIEAVRGVGIDGPLQTLLDRNVVRIAGRADLPGRPLLYETTELFLDHFGIRAVDELPNAAELRSVKLPEPEPPPAEETQADQTELPLERTSEESPADGKPKKKSRGRKKDKTEEAASSAEETPVAAEEEETPITVVEEEAPAAEEPAPEKP
jgi:segregation and condensation protein B